MVRPTSPRYRSAAWQSLALCRKSHYIDRRGRHKKFDHWEPEKAAIGIRVLQLGGLCRRLPPSSQRRAGRQNMRDGRGKNITIIRGGKLSSAQLAAMQVVGRPTFERLIGALYLPWLSTIKRRLREFWL